MDKREKFIIWCDKAMAFSFYALIYFLPISIALSEIFTGTSLICYLSKRGAIFYGLLKARSSEQEKLSFFGKIRLFLRSYKPIESDLSWPIVLFLFFNFVSVVTSQHPLLSIEGFLGKPLQSAFLYFTFIECINSRKRINIFLSVFLISCTLITVNGLYQYFVGQGFIHGYPFNGRVFSSFRHPNDFGAYLVVVVPLLLSLSVFARANGSGGSFRGAAAKPDFKFFSSRIGKSVIFVLLLLGLACLGLTYSRGAWLAFIVAVLFLGIFDRRILLINVAVLLLFFAVFYPQLTGGRGVNLITDTVKKESIVVNGKRVKVDKVELDVDGIENVTIPEGGLDFGDSDFTIDYWFYPLSVKNDDGQFALITDIENSLYLRSNTDLALELGRRDHKRFAWFKTFRHDFQVEQWHHIAVVRDGLFMHCYVNGNKKVSIPVNKEKISYKFITIGFWDTGNNNSGSMHGFIANFRITKGQALFTTEFKTDQLYDSLDRLTRKFPGDNVLTGLSTHAGEVFYALNARDQDSILVLHENDEALNKENSLGRRFIDIIYKKEGELKLKDRLAFNGANEKGIEFKKESFVDIQMKKIRQILQKFGGSGRFSYWEEAMNMVKDYPIFGTGLNTYSVVGRDYKISWGGYPHNCYLQMAVETGLLGLASFLWLVIVIFKKGIRNLFMIHNSFLHKLLLGLLSGFGGFLLQSFFDTSFYSVQLGSLMWVVMGFIVAIQKAELSQD